MPRDEDPIITEDIGSTNPEYSRRSWRETRLDREKRS
jgi:hypothetical protein